MVEQAAEKAGAIKRMDNERDRLCGFHLRNATFDAGCANAAAGRAINREKGWCAVRTLHNVHPTRQLLGRMFCVDFVAAVVGEHVDEGGVGSDSPGAEEVNVVVRGGGAGFVIEVVEDFDVVA